MRRKLLDRISEKKGIASKFNFGLEHRVTSIREPMKMPDSKKEAVNKEWNRQRDSPS